MTEARQCPEAGSSSDRGPQRGGGREAPPRFLCDAMLGRLARWLRTLGYDTTYDPAWEDAELIRRSDLENRTLLTRDTRIFPPRGVRLVLLHSDDPLEQLRELAATLGLARPPEPFRRCTLCNRRLQTANAVQVALQVPDYVRTAHRIFTFCPSCRRVFWRGTHRAAMVQALREVFPNLQEPGGG